jgi:hypothetical protein
MQFLSLQGFCVVAHDRRSHGRSGQASGGNDMNGYPMTWLPSSKRLICGTSQPPRIKSKSMQIYSHSCAVDSHCGNGRPLRVDGEAAPALGALVSTFNIVESSHV